MHRPQQGGPSFVVEGDYHTGVWELLQVQLVLAAGHRQSKSEGAARTHQKTPKMASISILITSKQLSSFFTPQNDAESINFLNFVIGVMNSCFVGLVSR